MKFHQLEPEVVGGFGPNSILDTSVWPLHVKHLHLEFDGWLGDHLLECFPCFVISQVIQRDAEEIGATGCVFDSVEVTLSQQFRALYPDREIPNFVWIKIVGTPVEDDFGISDDNCLIVSDRIFTMIKENGNLENCESFVVR